jgi:hypothetical protein
MMHIRHAVAMLLLIAGMLMVPMLRAQPTILWQRSIGGSQNDQAYGITILPDGGFGVAGFSRSNDGDFADHHGSAGTYDCAAIRLDSLGNVVWKQSLGGNEHDYCPCIVHTRDGGLVFAGGETSADGEFANHRGAAGTSDGWIVKLDSSGRQLWSRIYGGALNDGFSRIVTTNDGGFLAAGSSNSNDGDVHNHHPPATASDLWIAKVDSIGMLQWERSYGGSGVDGAFGLARTDDSAFVAFGFTASGDGDVHVVHGASDFWLVKINDTGAIVWERTFGCPNGQDMNSVTLTTDGGYIIGGSAYYDGGDITTPHHGHHDSYDIWIVRVSRSGDLVWQKSLGGNGHDYEQDVHATPDGGCLVSGYSTSNDVDVSGHHGDTTGYDAWVVKLDVAGNLQWQQSYGGSGMEGASGITPTADGGCVFGGNSSSTDGDLTGNPNAHTGSRRCWIVKLSPVPLGVADAIAASVDNLEVYPNPARARLHLRIRDGAPWDRADAELSDPAGRVVTRTHLSKGEDAASLLIDAAGVYSGSYLLRVHNGAHEYVMPRVVEIAR